MSLLDRELADPELLRLAQLLGDTFGKTSVTDLMELAISRCSVKKGRRPHIRKVMQIFVDSLLDCSQSNPEVK